MQTEYDGILSLIEGEKNLLEEYINQSEAQGWLVSENYYTALAANERENLAQLKAEEKALLSEYNEIMASGTIDETSEEWVNLCTSINDVSLAILESETALKKYDQTLQQLNFEIFDLLQDRISKITDESEFLIDLLSSDKLYDDNGRFTDEGWATAGLHGVNYNVHMAQADQAGAEAARLKKELESDPFDQDLLDRYNEMVALQQEHILAAEDEKDAIKSLVEEGIELELDALQDRIDAYNDALDSEKDLYEYSKKVAESTKEIASLQKQMAAYSGDDSEETKAKVQELKVSLEEAKTDLEETEYDQYISDQEKLLDELYLEYETILNERLDNLELLITEMTAQINAESANINQTLMDKVDSVGYDLSNSMSTIWQSSDFTDASGAVKNVITTYGDNFTNAWTTTNKALGDISTDIASMIGQLNKIAGTNVKTAQQSAAAKAAAEAAAKKKAEEEAAKKNNPKPSSSGDGTPRVGDKVKFVSGNYYYDSQGKRPIGSKYQGKEVYITKINTKSWATHPYHISTGSKLGSGDLGWLKLEQLSGYATGKKNIMSGELAWTQEDGREFIIRPSDGAILTPLAQGDSVLNAVASSNLWDMANSPAEFIKENLGLGIADSAIGQNSQTAISQNFENISFVMPNVKNYDQMLSQMKKDKNFQNLIDAMGVDQLAGKSALRKGKSIR